MTALRTKIAEPLLMLLVIGTASVAPAPQARADAPPCRYTIAGGTVIDKDVKLEWEQNADANSYTWTAAETRCQGLSLKGSGWRLPTIKEGHTLVDEKRIDPAIDTTAFPTALSEYYWSSTPSVMDGTQAWILGFADGGSYIYDKGDTAKVRCVRAAP